MPSNHLILCHPLLLLPSIFPRIRVFSDELVLLQSIGVSTLYVCSVQRQKGMPLDRTNFSIVNSNKLKYKVWVLSYFIRVWLFATRLLCPWGFSKQEYWTGLLCPSPGDLPDPGIKPVSLTSLAFAGRFFTTSATWEAHTFVLICLSSERKVGVTSKNGYITLHGKRNL